MASSVWNGRNINYYSEDAISLRINPYQRDPDIYYYYIKATKVSKNIVRITGTRPDISSKQYLDI